jgi:ABC-type Mn2+/Zn2+ transport system permease subunit
MKKIFYLTLLAISILGIPLSIFGIVNTGVSLKYETKNSNDCLSIVTGQDLCLTIKILQGLFVICILVAAMLLFFRKKLLTK